MEEVHWKYSVLSLALVLLLSLSGCGVPEPSQADTTTPGTSKPDPTAPVSSQTIRANHLFLLDSLGTASSESLEIQNAYDVKMIDGWKSIGHARIDHERHFEYDFTIFGKKLYGTATYYEGGQPQPYFLVFFGSPQTQYERCLPDSTSSRCRGGQP